MGGNERDFRIQTDRQRSKFERQPEPIKVYGQFCNEKLGSGPGDYLLVE